VQDEDGWTALHEAAYYGEIKIARMLIDAEARKDIQDNKGRLPYELTDSQSLKKLLRL
jgi:ankyrin repeat protein